MGHQGVTHAKGGGAVVGALWMFFISLLLFWLPVFGPLIAGFVGGKKAGGVGSALGAVFLPAIVLGFEFIRMALVRLGPEAMRLSLALSRRRGLDQVPEQGELLMGAETELDDSAEESSRRVWVIQKGTRPRLSSSRWRRRGGRLRPARRYLPRWAQPWCRRQ